MKLNGSHHYTFVYMFVYFSSFLSVISSYCLSVCLSKASPLLGHSLQSGGEAEVVLEVGTRGPHSGSSTLAHRDPHGINL